MSIDPSASTATNFSGLGSRLSALEIGPAPPQNVPERIARNVAEAKQLTGIDFALTGLRTRPTKNLLFNALPPGLVFNPLTGLIRVTTSNPIVLEGWDLTGGALFITGGDLTMRDCYAPHAISPSLDVRNNARVLAEYCEFDGLSSPFNVNAQVNLPSDLSVVTIRHSRIHSSGSDCWQAGSNSTLENCIVYNPGQGIGAHPDVASIITSPGVHENIAILGNLLIGNGPFGCNNVVRCNAERQNRNPPVAGATVRNIRISGNVMYDEDGDAVSSPISTGRRTSPGFEGVYFGNCEISYNWIDFHTVKADGGEDNAQGYAIWRENRKISTGQLTPGLPGWSS